MSAPIPPPRTARTPGRLLVALALCCLLPVGSAGCLDLEWDWETGLWYPKEPSATTQKRRVSPTTARDAHRERALAGHDTTPADTTTRDREARPQADADEAGLSGFYRLHLVSGPETAAAESVGPSIVTVPVARASACQVGGLLAELYPPVGPGGTEHRYYLVYQSPVAMRAAARMAAQLDVGTEGIATQAELEPLQAFHTAIPLYYELIRRGGEPALVDQLVARLDLAAGSDQVPELLRWAAALMAARIHADYRADAGAQSQALRAARAAAPPGSFEAFLAGAALVRWYDDYQRKTQAEDLAKELVVQFQTFRRTASYEWCLQIAKRAAR